jgi:hypothetical protein
VLAGEVNIASTGLCVHVSLRSMTRDSGLLMDRGDDTLNEVYYSQRVLRLR